MADDCTRLEKLDFKLNKLYGFQAPLKTRENIHIKGRTVIMRKGDVRDIRPTSKLAMYRIFEISIKNKVAKSQEIVAFW